MPQHRGIHPFLPRCHYCMFWMYVIHWISFRGATGFPIIARHHRWRIRSITRHDNDNQICQRGYDIRTSSITITTQSSRHGVAMFMNAITPPDNVSSITESASPPLSPRYDVRAHAPRGTSNSISPTSVMVRRTIGTVLAFQIMFSLLPIVVPPVQAASYDAFTDEQRLVAEAWRLVDNSFLDRTFHGQDWFQLRQKYVKQTKYRSMNEAQDAIAQMVDALGDKYTRYLPPAKYQSIVDSATGTLAGVGVEIGTNEEGKVLATDVEEKGPARAAGIQPGDVFVAVDGQSFQDNRSTPDDVALKLRGPAGSRVGVVMQRKGQTFDYILTRQPITVTSVRDYLSNVAGVGKVGVIRIKSFSATTASTVKEKYEQLKKQGAVAMLIDVRGNPGGLLPGGVDTASLFLDANKPLVFVVNKKGVVDAQATFTAGLDLQTPIVVLVDKNTASAAEVFTAALQENGRVIVAGERTFGKGIIQTIRELSNNNGGLAITVARYETPNHNDINKAGIAVDVTTSISCPKDEATACLTAEPFQKARRS